MQRRPYGPDAWLADGVESPATWAEALRAMAIPGIGEIVPAESTVVVRCARDRHAAVGDVLDRVVAVDRTSDPTAPLTIEVVYDGPDIAELASTARISVDDVIRLHATGSYEVAFCGFSPGFGYLRGLDHRLHVPRRSTPRVSVPAGSIGVAAGYTCVYPSPSPGGWYLIGHTTTTVWDADRDPPSRLVPGRPVRFRRVSA